MRQKQPTTPDDAVAATLEMESYLSPQAVNSTLQEHGESASGVGAVSQITQLARVVGRLAEQVEKMQQESKKTPAASNRRSTSPNKETIHQHVLELPPGGTHGP